MDPALLLAIVQIANHGVKLALDAGVSWSAFRAVQDKAAAEGRLMNADELRALVSASQEAIDRL